MKTILKTGVFILLASAFTPYSLATTVQFQTVAGDFEVNLFDQDTPETVDNFLMYVSEGRYEDVIFHRLKKGFVLQGGGFKLTDDQTSSVSSFASVVNEPEFSNVRGTIAMAKLANKPDSATSQWFFNLKDNSANLDSSNSGYSVFGVVTGNGMAIIDALANWNTFTFSNTFSDLPLRDYTEDDFTGSVLPTAENYALVYNIVVLDAAADTADSLSPSPTRNTAIGKQQPNTDTRGGGGSISILFLLALLGLQIGRHPKTESKKGFILKSLRRRTPNKLPV